MKIRDKYLIFTLFIFALFFNNGYSVTLNIPPRPNGAMTGTQFYVVCSSISPGTTLDNTVITQVTTGNIPDFQRTLKQITVTTTYSGATHTAIYYVVPDYLAIGADTDYFLMPMTPLAAQKIADKLGCNLPTRKMVDQIASSALVHLSPSPISPSAQMITVPVFWDHNTIVRQQRQAVIGTNPLGDLVDGDKKDIVVTPQLSSHTASVAIYGWHYSNGTYIQPLYLGHEITYADYSHGARLVNLIMTLDGITTTIPQVLQSPINNVILSDEGVNSTYRYGAIAVSTTTTVYFPYKDSFPTTGRQLSFWTDKFTTPVISAFSTLSPGGDGYVEIVHDPSGGMETSRIGNLTDSDYYVQCDIFCNYRPGLAADGFERCGIFIRDNGNGAFERNTGGGGYCYLMAWDSDSGRLWCMKSVNGATTDLSTTAMYYPSTGWHTMRIEAYGSQLTFKLDGTTILTATDTTYSQGQCGIGFHEYFTTNTNMLGTYADNFNADVLSVVAVKNWQLYY